MTSETDHTAMDTTSESSLNRAKLMFLYNALENGWRVHKKMNNVYVFSKHHHQDREYFQKSFLRDFVQMNLSL